MNLQDPDQWIADMEDELIAVVMADEVLGQFAITNERKGDIANEVQRGLGVFREGNGKFGACIVLLSAAAQNIGRAAPGGQMKMKWSYRVLEDPTINDGDQGFQIRALQICRRLVRVVSLYFAEQLCTALVTMEETIVPVVDQIAPIAYEVQFECTESRVSSIERVQTPVLSVKTGAAPQTVTITCGTAGADIYYTLDGKHPWRGQGTLYTGAVTVDAAGILRARAFKTNAIGSGTAAGIFT